VDTLLCSSHKVRYGQACFFAGDQNSFLFFRPDPDIDHLAFLIPFTPALEVFKGEIIVVLFALVVVFHDFYTFCLGDPYS